MTSRKTRKNIVIRKTHKFFLYPRERENNQGKQDQFSKDRQHVYAVNISDKRQLNKSATLDTATHNKENPRKGSELDRPGAKQQGLIQ